MQLPRIPPPPRPATVTPPPPPTQLGHGDLLASFEDDDQVLPAASNPHLQMYNGPTADFGLTPALQPSPAALPSGSTSQTRDQQQQQHPPPPHVHARHPPRRLSQIFSSLGPASPPVVSDQAGNGYILPPHSSIPNLNQTPNQHPASSTSTTANTASNNNSNNDEFGAFTSASASATATAAIAGEARPQQAHRRLSSFEGLWNLVPGSVATFPRRSGAAAGAGSGAGAPERSSSVMTTEATTAMEDVFHEEKDEATQGSQTQTGSGFPGLSDLFRSRSRDPSTSAAPAAQSSSTPPLPPPPPPSSSSANTSKLSNVLGSTIKAASKWKTVRGPSSFHPVPPSSSSYLQEDPHTASSSTTTTTTRRTGYALRYPFIEDADDFLTPGSSSSGIPPTAKPFVITHTSPFAPSTSTTPSSTSFTSASLSPPRRGLLMGGPLSGAPGYRREDDYLGSTRPVSSFTNEVQAGASASAGGAGRRGKTAGKQNGQDQRIDAGAVVGNEGEDGKDENGITNGQNGNINGQGSSSREWTGTKLVGRREGTDVVLDQKAADALRPFLPPRQRLSRTWTMLYSTDQHGASLTTFYRLLEAYSRKNPQAGNILIVRDALGRRFGVFMNEVIKKAEGTYTGSGESWLFKLVKDDDDDENDGADGRIHACVFRWTGKNHYFALCESDFISFGGGDGRYGLWIDKNLYHGSSAPCPAYDNEVLCAPPGDTAQRGNFECYGLEVWATS